MKGAGSAIIGAEHRLQAAFKAVAAPGKACTGSMEILIAAGTALKA